MANRALRARTGGTRKHEKPCKAAGKHGALVVQAAGRERADDAVGLTAVCAPLAFVVVLARLAA